eukprot:TCALIF_08337-PA protein Name:"Similar to HLHmbeta Enhancer of split mbeta protein (Drosophila melanogaster)" AED:0.02 eAED:0.02 QI:0/-1/0/1/-1/1/1/0/197
MSLDQETPMSRTHQYRKVMKPLLERKRRARINKCLDELKDLMVYAVQAEGESITKLEKADVLELTVQHLNKLKRQQQLQANPALEGDRYRSGFTACANEVGRFLASVPGVNIHLGTSIMSHLGSAMSANNASPVSPVKSSPLSIHTCASSPMVKQEFAMSPSTDGGYNSGRDSTPSPSSIGAPSPRPASTEAVWRPF